jgi:hypothetical protein
MEKVEESEFSTLQETSRTRWIFREILDSRVRYLQDADGRPLGEQKVPELYEAVETELARCPYHGSRHHHTKLMNVSALRQMTSHWPVILGGLREVHREYRDRIAADPLTISDLYNVIGTGVLLPAYVTLRADGRMRDGEIPVWLSGVYKVLIGIYAPVGQLMIGQLLLGRGAAPLPSAEALLEYVESTNALIGKREVCAGPPALILRALRTIISGDTDEPVDTTPFHQTLKKGSLTEFALAASDLLLLHFIYVLRMRQNSSRLETLVRQAAGDVEPSVAESILSRLQLFSAEQSNPMADLCRRVEKIQGIDMNALTSLLVAQAKTIEIEAFDPIRKPLEGEAREPLSKLLAEEEAACGAEENAFRIRGTELSRSILTTLGHVAAGPAEVEPQDVAHVLGKTLGETLREIRSELLHFNPPFTN